MNFKRNFLNSILYLIPLNILIYIKDHFKVIRKMDYVKKDIYLDLDSEVEYKYRLKSCYHEPDTVQWIEDNLKQNEVLFDIGANIGTYSLIASKQNNNSNKIFSFEPNFTSYNKLCKNIILNNCEKQVYALNIALSNKYILDTFNYFDLEIGSAYHTLSNNTTLNNKPVYKQKVITYTLDKLIEDFDIDSPNHIKIDVDGTELDILKGGYKTIMNPEFKSLVVEIDENAENFKEIIEYIEKLGLKFHKKYTDPNADDPIECNYKIYNYIFYR